MLQPEIFYRAASKLPESVLELRSQDLKCARHTGPSGRSQPVCLCAPDQHRIGASCERDGRIGSRTHPTIKQDIHR